MKSDQKEKLTYIPQKDIRELDYTNSPYTALEYAIIRQSLDDVKYFLETKANDPNDYLRKGKSYLCLAIESGSVDIVKIMLDNDANPSQYLCNKDPEQLSKISYTDGVSVESIDEREIWWVDHMTSYRFIVMQNILNEPLSFKYEGKTILERKVDLAILNRTLAYDYAKQLGKDEMADLIKRHSETKKLQYTQPLNEEEKLAIEENFLSEQLKYIKRIKACLGQDKSIEAIENLLKEKKRVNVIHQSGGAAASWGPSELSAEALGREGGQSDRGQEERIHPPQDESEYSRYKNPGQWSESQKGGAASSWSASIGGDETRSGVHRGGAASGWTDRVGGERGGSERASEEQRGRAGLSSKGEEGGGKRKKHRKKHASGHER